ncbi:MAG: 1,4-alpha-glucan branching protein GlgB [Bryobacteraceae bacterium]|jgi:1,4-alpha-glucan branching enzyme
MTPGEMEAIVGGWHGDAFALLGPHRNEDGGWEVRALLPQASDAQLHLDGQFVPMEKVDPQGLFTGRLENEPGRYRLVLKLWSGGEAELEDPYRFPPLLSEFDLHLNTEGTNSELWHSLGAHLVEVEGVPGVRFAVWAPNALVVSVVGDFNEWDTRRHPMRMRDGGVWEIFIPHIGSGTHYKYSVRSRFFGYHQLKADPCAFACEEPPKSASIVADLAAYSWGDQQWTEERGRTDWLRRPFSVYEVHLGSFLRGPRNEVLSYRDLAAKLVSYVKDMGYTHIELLPIMEHPYSGSWGYQVTGYFTPTARFGPPEDFMYFVDRCHQEGVGVIVDWVPAHFPKDAHGLAFFDGTALYEHADPRKGEHKEWGTLVFNYGRNEVRSFLVSNAMFWLKEYHIDGLRVDAVAAILYLDYSRKAGEWIPNMYGGNENLEAISFLRRFNELAHTVPGTLTIAEESTAFAGVSKPVYMNGLGFTMKWNMGWMHDMLSYFSNDPIFRRYHHNNITFSMLYAFTENFVLPISHDEVVHGKGALLAKMPGDVWQKFANVRAFLTYMYTHPGKKLLFMGSEIGQWNEWNHDRSVEWDLLQFEPHRKLQNFVRDLNRLYRAHPALYDVDFQWQGFEWVDFHDVDHSVISFLRRPRNGKPFLLMVCNFTPTPHLKYRVGVPDPGLYREIFNSDAEIYGGSNMGNGGGAGTQPVAFNNHYHSLEITLPPLAVVVFASPEG